MTLSQALQLANRRGFATADFNLEDHARYNALPQFVRDVRMVIGGFPYWHWKTTELIFQPGQTLYDLPADFSRFMEIRPIINGSAGCAMTYIGERPEKVLSAEIGRHGATPSAPGAYYVVHKSRFMRFGPVITTDHGYVYDLGPAWPPSGSAVPVFGSDVLVFSTYASPNYSYSSGLLRFDTSTIPRECAVVGATLQLNLNDSVFDTDGKTLLIEWYDPGTIDSGDYTTTPVDGAGVCEIRRLVQGVNKLQLTDVTQINRDGYTGLRFQLDAALPQGPNSIRISTERFGGAFGPEFGPEFEHGGQDIQDTCLILECMVPMVRPFQLKLTGPVDQTYTAVALYNWQLPVDVVDPELNAWMPPEVQGLFVQRLRADILLDAFGQGDARYEAEYRDYQQNLETLLPHSEAAMKTRQVFVR